MPENAKSSIQAMALGTGTGDDDDSVLQAVVLADSFNQRFKPLTSHKPRCLLPICGASLLEWTFESLVLAGVQEIFVVCRSHADLIKQAIANSKYSSSSSHSRIRIKPIITAQETFAPGDALRDIYTHGIITSDFVLVSGDLVSSVDINQAVRLHRIRRKANKDTIMTMVVRECGGEHPTRPRGDTGMFILAPTTSECLHYEPIIASPAKSHFTIPREILQRHPEIEIRNDLLDCAIDICSVEVPLLFQDNFDYLDIRRDFVHGILTSDLLSRNIYCHVIKEGYAGRVKDTKTFEAVSQDILSRWTFPLVPDANYPGEVKYHILQGNCYFPADNSVIQSRTSAIGPNTLIAPHTRIEDHVQISRSTIGRNVVVGAGSIINGSHVFSGCRIGSRCSIEESILGENVQLQEGCIVPKGCRIGDAVVLGPKTALKPFSRVSRLRLDEESEDVALNNGKGYLWPPQSTDEDDGANESELYENQQFLIIGAPDWVSDSDTDSISSAEEATPSTPTAHRLATAGNIEKEFLNECNASLQRAFEENHSIDNAAVELKTLRMASNVPLRRVREVIIQRLMQHALTAAGDNPPTPRLVSEVNKTIRRWGGLVDAIGGVDGVETIEILQVQSSNDKSLLPVFSHMLTGFYNVDVIEEGDIREWYRKAQGKEMEKSGEYCRQVVGRLLERLDEQSSEESDSE